MTFQVKPDVVAVCAHPLRYDRLATTSIRGILLGTRVLYRNVDDLPDVQTLPLVSHDSVLNVTLEVDSVSLSVIKLKRRLFGPAFPR